MKYLLFFILFSILFALSFGYYLYWYDKRDVDILSQNFWENVTPDQLKKKLKGIKNVNKVRPNDKRSMLHQLVLFGRYPKMIPLLISAGVDYTLQDVIGGKALHFAVKRGDQAYEFTKELIVYDKDIDGRDVRFLSTPLHWAVYSRAQVSVIKLLLNNNADVNIKTKYGNTSLIIASKPNPDSSFIDLETIQILLDYKADITIQNLEGKTAYDYMKENKEFKKTELFKKLSAQFE